MGIEDSFNFRRTDGRLTTSGVVSVEQLSDLHREGYGAVSPAELPAWSTFNASERTSAGS